MPDHEGVFALLTIVSMIYMVEDIKGRGGAGYSDSFSTGRFGRTESKVRQTQPSAGRDPSVHRLTPSIST